MVEDRKAGEAGDVQTLIDELAAHSSELSALLHETVTALAELVQDGPPRRSPTPARRRDRSLPT